jgi:cell division septum initiation protein DivIVA
MARESTPFPVTRLRGYDISQVNAFLRAAIAERRRLSAENDELKEALRQKSTELATRQPLSPSTVVSADQAAAILASAQRTAELTVAEARHQAAETLRAAVERAEALAEASERQLALTREQLNATQVRLVGLQALETEYRGRLRTWASGVLIELDDGQPSTPRSTAPAYETSFQAPAEAMPAQTVTAELLPDDLAPTYHVDVTAGQVRFGDGERGRQPVSVFDVPAFRDGLGAAGNVAPRAAVSDPEVDIPPSVFPDGAAPTSAVRPARSWFAPVGSPHRPADV